MRRWIAAFALLLALSAGRALAQSEVRAQIGAATHLDADGTFRVVESYDIQLQGGFDSFDWEVGVAADQKLEMERIVRVDENGVEHPLQAASAPGPDRYFLGRSFARIGLDQPGQEIIRRQYRIEYRLAGALAPAWDIPAGPAPPDALEVTLRKPWERWSEALALWREAWPEIKTRYRLDHDFMYPLRSSPKFTLSKKEALHYDLGWDSTAWRLLGTHESPGVDHPESDFRVQRTFERIVPGRPAAVDFRSPTFRVGAIVAVPVVGFALWLLVLVARIVRWALGPKADAAFFEEKIAPQPPERIAALMDQEIRLRFEPVLRRLAGEHKLAVEVVEPGTDDRAGKTRLRLLVDRDGLHPMDRDVIDAFFPSGQTAVGSDDVRQRYAGGDKSVADEVAGILPVHIPTYSRRGSILTWGAGAVFFLGLWYVLHETTSLIGSPFLIMGGLFGALLTSGSPTSLRGQPPWPASAILLVSLAVASGYLGVAHFVTNTPIGPNGAVGLSLMVLSGFAGALARTFLRGPREQALETLWRARTWASRELARPRPALKDAWISRLEALGLGANLRRWQTSIAGTGGEQTDYTAAPTGPPFSGNARPLPDPGGGWSEAFYPEA
jgi:hypothetical protein